VKYRVQLAPSAAEAFAALNPFVSRQINAGLKELADNPYVGKELQDDLSEFRSYRIKRYRVVFKVVDKEKNLKVFAIGHRREIYDLFADFINKK